MTMHTDDTDRDLDLIVRSTVIIDSLHGPGTTRCVVDLRPDGSVRVGIRDADAPSTEYPAGSVEADALRIALRLLHDPATPRRADRSADQPTQ